MRLYRDQEIDEFVFPDMPSGEMLKNLTRNDLRLYIGNAYAEIAVLDVEGRFYPVVITEERRHNSYVCSLRASYIDYAQVEMRRIVSKTIFALSAPLWGFLRLLFSMCQSEDVVYFNNWLVSTNLYSKKIEDDFVSCVDYLKTKFADKAIVLRSLNEREHQKIIEKAKSIGANLVLTRRVFHINPAEGKQHTMRHFRQDLKLLKRCRYELSRPAVVSEDVARRAEELYRMLYIDKYCVYNPHFTWRWIQEGVRVGFLNLIMFAEDGEIVGVAGYISHEGVMTAPLLGYDLRSPRHATMYRLLTTQLTCDAEERGLYMNRSSGAEDFKMNRGSEPSVEYMAVFASHLPLRRRLAWSVFATITDLVRYVMKW